MVIDWNVFMYYSQEAWFKLSSLQKIIWSQIDPIQVITKMGLLVVLWRNSMLGPKVWSLPNRSIRYACWVNVTVKCLCSVPLGINYLDRTLKALLWFNSIIHMKSSCTKGKSMVFDMAFVILLLERPLYKHDKCDEFYTGPDETT